jgi:hypothetical protein
MALAPPVAEQRWLARSAFAGNDDALGHLLTIHRPTAMTLAVSPRSSRPRASGRTYASGANPYLRLTRA